MSCSELSHCFAVDRQRRDRAAVYREDKGRFRSEILDRPVGRNAGLVAGNGAYIEIWI